MSCADQFSVKVALNGQIEFPMVGFHVEKFIRKIGLITDGRNTWKHSDIPFF